jgi:hypothetical protein
MNRNSMAVFLLVALSIWGLMHAYVFWRAASVPWVAAHVSSRRLVTAAVVLWAIYPTARTLNAHHIQVLGVPLEFVGTTWTGFLFLAFAAVLVTDLCTLGGLLFPRLAPALIGRSLAAALALAWWRWCRGCDRRRSGIMRCGSQICRASTTG